MGIFFFLFSINTVQYIILLGSKLSNLSFILKLVTLMPIPLLTALFMGLAFSNLIQMGEENEEQRQKTGLLSIPNILAIAPMGYIMPTLSLSPLRKLSPTQSSAYSYYIVSIFFFLSLATMTSSNLVMMSTLQDQWNVTHGHDRWDHECHQNNQHPQPMPDKCYGMELKHEVQNDFTLFSMSQLLLTESFLLLSIFITLTGNRITKKSLFFPGLFLFIAAILTIIAFFTGIGQYDLQTNGFPFLILSSVNTISAVIIGVICVIAGGSVFISCITVFLRIILSIFVLGLIIILTTLEALLKLASLNTKVKTESKVEEEPEVNTA